VQRTCVAAAGLYCGMGMVIPVAPTVASIVAVILVRILVWTKTKSIVWNVTVCGLAMLAAFASIEGSEMSVFYGFWTGVGFGSLGVGIIELGRGMVNRVPAERFKQASNILFGIKNKSDDTDE
jgi:glycerol-3-phosphate acyltransferase PlsY